MDQDNEQTPTHHNHSRRNSEIMNRYGWAINWINRYGFPTVAVVFLYFDFIRPLKDERNEFNQTITSVMSNQTKLIEQLVDYQATNLKKQEALLSNQEKMMKNQEAVIDSVKALSEYMKGFIEAEKILKQTEPRKIQDPNEC